jgi:hypothetical protein
MKKLYLVKMDNSKVVKCVLGWVGWMGGWMDVKAILRIVYNNKNHIVVKFPF